ncbi:MULTISPECIES: hypothetical protein [Methylosinus]|uniref:DUF4386 domain-containing protein n=1 Tax=Methylosinus trichosporium (strain ATCC 35070 / NCIMB 11131 / UNIQEM 75 / OB3b) TaxID=595536 RepID=A0A2D2D513_METT3|nr:MULTISPECIES: hypothetical protein [Methylosinus]ATQ69909.1 hypothetical protein CQW49_19985 [Methylosinus trichosporium OB3b]OBS53876.1 hypothetical protein A8B73_03670 [Methylosinus sp. 3S-1]
MALESENSSLDWLCLVLAPAVLASMELFHPAHFTHAPGMYAYLSAARPYAPAFEALGYSGPHWWVALHLIQLPMLALVALGLWRLVDGVSEGVAGLAARLSRAGAFVFAILYTALDSIGGVGLGRSILDLEAMRAAGSLTPEEAAGAVKLLDAVWVDPVTGGVGSFVSLGGSWAAFVAAAAAAFALGASRRAPWPALALLLFFGWELQISHAAPHGPAAFASLMAAALWLRLEPRLRVFSARPGSAPSEAVGASFSVGERILVDRTIPLDRKTL